jgi:hypothetical protein
MQALNPLPVPLQLLAAAANLLFCDIKVPLLKNIYRGYLDLLCLRHLPVFLLTPSLQRFPFGIALTSFLVLSLSAKAAKLFSRLCHEGKMKVKKMSIA